MSVVRQYWMRPVVLDTPFTYQFDGSNRTLQAGTYASVLTVLGQIEETLTGDDATFEATLDSDGKVVLDWSGAYNLDLEPSTDTRLKDLLGFNIGACGSVGTPHTADELPECTWLSTYSTASQFHFADTFDNIMSERGADGLTCSLVIGDTLYMREWRYEYEPAANITPTSVQSTEVDRSLVTFLRGAMSEQVSSTSHGRPCGFWIYYNHLLAQPTDDHDLSSGLGAAEDGNNTHCYVTVLPDEVGRLEPSLARTRARYSISIETRTATPPTGFKLVT
jgi:hypothetical protein